MTAICSLFYESSPLPGLLMCSEFEEVHAPWGMSYKILTCAQLHCDMLTVNTKEMCCKLN